MQRLFKETPIFTARLKENADSSLLFLIQGEILQNPKVGDVVAGTGGVRKMRVRDATRSKGKRGGLRILYLDLPAREITFLLYLYGKDETEDISSEEKKEFKRLVSIIKGEE